MAALLSIIVPTYQEEKNVASFLSQFSAPFCAKYAIEIILSDGGSTDATVEIARRFQSHLPLRIVTHPSCRRQTIAEGRNAGASYASGQTYIFLNVDTSIANPDHFFARIAEWTKSGGKHIVALNPTIYIDPHQAILFDHIWTRIFNSWIRFLNSIGVGAARGEAQIVRAAAFWQIHGYNPYLTAGEDFDFYHRLAKIGKIQNCRDLIVYESPRRFRTQGYLKTFFLWAQNWYTVRRKNHSYSKEWTVIR